MNVIPFSWPVELPAKPPVAQSALRETVSTRGYQVQYRPGVDCPGCGHRGFHVGRQSAECGKCGTALPLAPAGAR